MDNDCRNDLRMGDALSWSTSSLEIVLKGPEKSCLGQNSVVNTEVRIISISQLLEDFSREQDLLNQGGIAIGISHFMSCAFA